MTIGELYDWFKRIWDTLGTPAGTSVSADIAEAYLTIREIERHLHQNVCEPTPTNVNRNCASDGAADTFGTWYLFTSNAELQACGITPGLKFDAHEVVLRTITNNRRLVVQIGFGDGTPGGTTKYNGCALTSDSVRSSSYIMPGRRITMDWTGNLYYRMKDGTGGATIAGAWPNVHWYEAGI